MRVEWGQQIPIHVIAIGDRYVGLKRKRPAQEAVARGSRQKVQGLVSAGTGIEQHAKSIRPHLWTGERRELPALAQAASVAAHEREAIAPPGFEISDVKMPVLASSVAHAALHRRVADAQARCSLQRRVERCLDQQSAVADGGNEVTQRAWIPTPGRRGICPPLCVQCIVQAKSERRGSRSAQEFTPIDEVHEATPRLRSPFRRGAYALA